jgi:hypothetical protein
MFMCQHDWLIDCEVVRVEPQFVGDDGLRQQVFAECLTCDLILHEKELKEVLNKHFKVRT